MGSIPRSDANSVHGTCSNQSNCFCYYDCKITTQTLTFVSIKRNTESLGIIKLYMVTPEGMKPPNASSYVSCNSQV